MFFVFDGLVYQNKGHKPKRDPSEQNPKQTSKQMKPDIGLCTIILIILRNQKEDLSRTPHGTQITAFLLNRET